MEKKKKNILELTNCTLEEYHVLHKLPIAVMADNVRSAQNIGAMLRTADAFLIGEFIMAGISATPPSAEISKTALGAEQSVSWRHVEDALAEAEAMQRDGWMVCVLEQTHNSVDLRRLPLQRDAMRQRRGVLLVVGNEVHGVNQQIADMADLTIEIPMHGTKHSLNVSTSAGIAMWELYKLLGDA